MSQQIWSHTLIHPKTLPPRCWLKILFELYKNALFMPACTCNKPLPGAVGSPHHDSARRRRCPVFRPRVAHNSLMRSVCLAFPAMRTSLEIFILSNTRTIAHNWGCVCLKLQHNRARVA